MQKRIWLAYVSYPVTTAAYMETSLRRLHKVTTMGPKINDDVIRVWNLQNMKREVKDHDFPIHPEADMKELTAHLKPSLFPDVYLWIESVYGYFPKNLDFLKCPKACYLIDTHLNKEWHLKWAKNFDYIFLAQREYVPEFHRAGLKNTYWLPLGCDTNIHAKFSDSKKFEIGFAGSIEPGSRRESLINKLKVKFPVEVKRCFLEEMALLFSESKVVFNNAVRNDLNMRVFEVMSTGSFLLTDNAKNSGLDQLFIDGEDLCIYNDEDIFEKAAFYLEHDSLRESIAARGMRLVHDAHTYDKRCADMLEVITGNRQSTPDIDELRELSLKKVIVPAPDQPKRKLAVEEIMNYTAPAGARRSFIIPVLDMSSQTEYTFNTLLNDLSGIEGEVIAVFNSIEMAEQFRSHPRITFSASMSHNFGVARAWNIGLDMSTAPIAFILNSDLHITVDAVSALEKALYELPEAAIAGPEGGFIDFGTADDIERFRHGECKEPLRVDNVSGFLFAVKTEYFNCGLLKFENAFTPCYFEEWDMGLQVKRAGLSSYIVPLTGYEHEFNAVHRKGLIRYLDNEESLSKILERNQILFWQKWLRIADQSTDKSFLVSLWYNYQTRKGEELIIQNNLDEAGKVFNRLLEEEPRDFKGYFYMGIINYKLNNKAAAKQYFEAAQKINPRSRETAQYIELLGG